MCTHENQPRETLEPTRGRKCTGIHVVFAAIARAHGDDTLAASPESIADGMFQPHLERERRPTRVEVHKHRGLFDQPIQLPLGYSHRNLHLSVGRTTLRTHNPFTFATIAR